MIPVALDRIDHQTPLDLVGTPESKTLEFKGELPPKNDGARVLARGSALANTLGGDFVIGVTEKDGVTRGIDHDAEQVASLASAVGERDQARGVISQVVGALIENVCADATNIVILPISMTREGANVLRLVVERPSANEGTETT